MTKNISEEIIEKIKKLPETHKQEIENIGFVLENLKKNTLIKFLARLHEKLRSTCLALF